jgi:5-methylcytosine-specific restriction endonuclease McrA
MTYCVLLNADYSFLNMVHWKRAMCMVTKQKVQVLSYAQETVRGGEGFLFKIPAVMKLIKLIRTIYRARVPFSKRNVLIRDGFACAYCGATVKNLTVDHLVPRARGGISSFENCVSCCQSCNHKKDCRTPSEANMFLRVKPYQPTISEFLRLKFAKLGIYDMLKEAGIYF